MRVEIEKNIFERENGVQMVSKKNGRNLRGDH